MYVKFGKIATTNTSTIPTMAPSKFPINENYALFHTHTHTHSINNIISPAKEIPSRENLLC